MPKKIEGGNKLKESRFLDCLCLFEMPTELTEGVK